MVTTTELLKKIKAAAMVPTHQITYQDTDILDLTNEEMDNLIVPMIMAMREEFFVTKSTIPIAIGVDTVAIPERAVGRTIREIKVLTTDATNPRSLSRASITEDYAFSTTPGFPQYHYFQGDIIKIAPIPDEAYGDYILWWECRPSRLVKTTDVGIITAFSDTTVTVQQNLNTNITTGAIIDITKAKAGYSNIYFDETIATMTTGLGPKVLTITGFSSSDPLTGISVGDRVSLAFTSDIVQLPDEAVAALVQAVALRIMQGVAQPEQYVATEKLLNRNLESLKSALMPRNEGASFKIRCHSPAFGPGKRYSIIGSSSGT